MLKDGQAEQLKEAGLDYYNHNIDTDPALYGTIITTRDQRDLPFERPHPPPRLLAGDRRLHQAVDENVARGGRPRGEACCELHSFDARFGRSYTSA